MTNDFENVMNIINISNNTTQIKNSTVKSYLKLYIKLKHKKKLVISSLHYFLVIVNFIIVINFT